MASYGNGCNDAVAAAVVRSASIACHIVLGAISIAFETVRSSLFITL
jgi:hypothetical protein